MLLFRVCWKDPDEGRLRLLRWRVLKFCGAGWPDVASEFFSMRAGNLFGYVGLFCAKISRGKTGGECLLEIRLDEGNLANSLMYVNFKYSVK